MPLQDGYGVLIGSLRQYYCDTRHLDDQYYHCNLKIRALMEYYRCAIDLDSKHQVDGMQWRVVELGLNDLKGIIHRRDGWYELEPTPESGALDYYLSPELQPTVQCVRAGMEDGGKAGLAEKSASECTPWKYGTGTDAFRELEPLLKRPRRLFVFGEPFRTGKGVHNIHQNQGDPPESRWVHENGPWQDGALVAQRLDNTVAAFMCKFKTQKYPDFIPETARLPM